MSDQSENTRNTENTTTTAKEEQPVQSAAELAREERAASRRLWLGDSFYVLLGVAVVYWVSLFLPQVTGVPGVKVITVSQAAREADVKITEYVFAIMAFLGVGVFTPLTLIFKRSALAQIAWMASTVALIEALLALWLRQTRPGMEESISAGVGTYLAIAVVLVAVVVYARIVLRRSPEQRRLAQARANSNDLDEVAYAQRATIVRQQELAAEDQDNELLRDDRRSRAARRHEAARQRSEEEQQGE